MSTPPVFVIALIGHKASGKSTVSKELVKRFGFTPHRFAQALKDMLAALGLTHEQLDGKDKEVPLALLSGQSARHAMQTLGHEWRNTISRDLWSNITVRRIRMDAESRGGEQPLFVVVDDVRYPHELDALRDAGFTVQVWRILRPDFRPVRWKMWFARRDWGVTFLKLIGQPFPGSEAWWEDLPADIEIVNGGSIPVLHKKVRALVYEQTPVKLTHLMRNGK